VGRLARAVLVVCLAGAVVVDFLGVMEVLVAEAVVVQITVEQALVGLVSTAEAVAEQLLGELAVLQLFSSTLNRRLLCTMYT
jgi:hypothetical protein